MYLMFCSVVAVTVAERVTFPTLWHAVVCTNFCVKYTSSMDQLLHFGSARHCASALVRQNYSQNMRVLLIRLVSPLLGYCWS